MARVPVEPFRTMVEHVGSEMKLTLPLPYTLTERIGRVLFCSAWLVGWAFGATHEFPEAIRRLGKLDFSPDTLFLTAWSVFWLMAGVFVASTILWTLGGRTTLTLAPETLRVRHAVGPASKSRDYNLADIKGFRIAQRLGGKSRSPYSVLAFDYGSKTVSVGANLSVAELAHIRDLVLQRAPQLKEVDPLSSLGA